MSSLSRGKIGPDEEASERLRPRRRRPSLRIADDRRERVVFRLRSVLLGVAGGRGAAILGSVGGGGIVGCVVGIAVRAFWAIISGELEVDEAVVSALDSPAASRPAVCRLRAAIAVLVWRDEIFGCLGGTLVYVSRIVICGGSETGEALGSALDASRSVFCCGGAALVVPVGGIRINVCIVGVLVRVSRDVLSGGFEANEALVSAPVLLVASCSAFRCGAAVVAVPVGGNGTLVCMGRILVCVSPIVVCGGLRINEASVSTLAFSAASRSAFCCRMILSTN